MSERTYIVAVKSDKRELVSPDWIKQLDDVPGVKVQNKTPSQAVISADDEGINHVRRQFKDSFIIEELLQRS